MMATAGLSRYGDAVFHAFRRMAYGHASLPCVTEDRPIEASPVRCVIGEGQGDPIEQVRSGRQSPEATPMLSPRAIILTVVSKNDYDATKNCVLSSLSHTTDDTGIR